MSGDPTSSFCRLDGAAGAKFQRRRSAVAASLLVLQPPALGRTLRAIACTVAGGTSPSAVIRSPFASRE